MKKWLDTLAEVPLFESIAIRDLQALLQCLGSRIAEYTKGEYLCLAGEKLTEVGILLSGSLQILRDDAAGNRLIVDDLTASSLFGEAFVCAGVDKIPVTILATEDSTVMYIQLKRILTVCSSSCFFHGTMIANLLKIIAQKNIILNNKILLLSQRSIREKIIAFLLMQVEKNNDTTFEIPFSRNELADFLCVDRSALSRELSKMQNEGLIKYHRNLFSLNLDLINEADYEHL